jgi:hypothetical protein
MWTIVVVPFVLDQGSSSIGDWRTMAVPFDRFKKP